MLTDFIVFYRNNGSLRNGLLLQRIPAASFCVLLWQSKMTTKIAVINNSINKRATTLQKYILDLPLHLDLNTKFSSHWRVLDTIETKV